MKNIKIIEGTSMKNAPANLKGSPDLSSEKRIWAGRVRFSRVRRIAAKTSFQEVTKAKMAEAAIPGKTNGATTLKNACSGVQPKTVAASSNSYGTVAKTLEITRTELGKTSAVCRRATLRMLSYIPKLIKITA